MRRGSVCVLSKGNVVNRCRAVAGLFLTVCAGLFILTGCFFEEGDSTSSTTSPKSSGDKAAFCRDVNTAVNIAESPGPSLNETQTNDMIKALQSASNEAPDDVPADMKSAITALLADLQAPTENIPPSFNTNGDKLSQGAADYCG